MMLEVTAHSVSLFSEGKIHCREGGGLGWWWGAEGGDEGLGQLQRRTERNM